LHERVGSAIERLAGVSTEEEVSTLALHFFEAQQHDKAWNYCCQAGSRAKAVSANIEAARFFERALSSARKLRNISDDERADAWIQLSEVREAAGLFEKSFEAMRRATRLLPANPVARAFVYHSRSRARSRSGKYSQALREAATGLRLVDQLEGRRALAARASLDALRAEIRTLQGHPREAIRVGEIAVAEARRARAYEALARAYSALDGAYQMLGEPEKAVNEHKALEIYARLGKVRQLGVTELNLGVQASADGRWPEAADLYERAREDLHRAGDRATAALATANLGELLVSRGSLEEAETLLSEARHILRASGRTPYALFAETQLARISLARGRPSDALAALEKIAGEASGIGHAGIILEITIYHAEAVVAAGDARGALAVLARATEMAGEDAALLAVPLGRVRGLALVSMRRYAEARQELHDALAGATRQGLLYEQLLIRDRLTLLGGLDGTEPSPEELREIERLRQLLGLEHGSG
jgi:tetratricopeptide (TPR) repeat protein